MNVLKLLKGDFKINLSSIILGGLVNYEVQNLSKTFMIYNLEIVAVSFVFL